MTDPLAEALRELRKDYLRDSVARVAELELLLEGVQRGDPAALDGLRRAFHKLAGSGGSYGFDVVSSESRSGETIVKRLLEAGAAPGAGDLAALTASVAAVKRAFEQARLGEGGVAGG